MERRWIYAFALASLIDCSNPLRDKRVTSTLIGAISPEQVADSVQALDNLSFAADELKEIDRHAVEGGVNLWRKSAELEA